MLLIWDFYYINRILSEFGLKYIYFLFSEKNYSLEDTMLKYFYYFNLHSQYAHTLEPRFGSTKMRLWMWHMLMKKIILIFSSEQKHIRNGMESVGENNKKVTS